MLRRAILRCFVAQPGAADGEQVTRILSHSEAKAFYDRFGARQDSQRFYEDAAVADLIAHSDMRRARAVFEFGCGTGRLAAHLLADCLPPMCRYRAVDVSETMVRLARRRLAGWEDRADVTQSTGSVTLDAESAGFDRFVVAYVLDLLDAEDTRGLLDEAHRILEPGGLFCAVGLTYGGTLRTRAVSLLWQALFRLNPRLLGGCRPIVIADHLRSAAWALRHRNVVTRFGISSEVVVAVRDHADT